MRHHRQSVQHFDPCLTEISLKTADATESTKYSRLKPTMFSIRHGPRNGGSHAQMPPTCTELCAGASGADERPPKVTPQTTHATRFVVIGRNVITPQRGIAVQSCTRGRRGEGACMKAWIPWASPKSAGHTGRARNGAKLCQASVL